MVRVEMVSFGWMKGVRYAFIGYMTVGLYNQGRALLGFNYYKCKRSGVATMRVHILYVRFKIGGLI